MAQIHHVPPSNGHQIGGFQWAFGVFRVSPRVTPIALHLGGWWQLFGEKVGQFSFKFVLACIVVFESIVEAHKHHQSPHHHCFQRSTARKLLWVWLPAVPSTLHSHRPECPGQMSGKRLLPNFALKFQQILPRATCILRHLYDLYASLLASRSACCVSLNLP